MQHCDFQMAAIWKQLFLAFETETSDSSENRFQPTKKDSIFARQIMFCNAPLHIWIDAAIFYPNFRVEYRVEKDQEIRARALINLYFKTGRDIVLMDGHGRIVRRLLMGGIPPNAIHVVELDVTVHEFHKWFFPRGVRSYLGNIFTTVVNSRNPFYYYNFCGIRESLTDIQTIKHEHMISFSVARSNTRYGKQLSANKRRLPRINRFKNVVTKKVNAYLQNRGGKLIAYRPDFITLWVNSYRD